jgi:polyisoprenoid-binding protein YceI
MGAWQLDPMHTQVEFAVKHLGMMTVRGHFADVQASGVSTWSILRHRR